MYGAISLFLFYFGAITTLGQASAVPSSREIADVQLGILGSGSGDMIAAVGNFDNRALKTSTVRSFDITITVEYSNKLSEGSSIEVTIYGSSGAIETYTVYAPKRGKENIYEFCLDAEGETELSSYSDKDGTCRVDVDCVPWYMTTVDALNCTSQASQHAP